MSTNDMTDHMATPPANVTPLHGDGDGPGFRSPPHNFEAEMALLGAILVNNRSFERVQEFLFAEHFADPAHARVYEACAHLIERGQIADPITLKNYFKDDEDLKAIGGQGYIAELANSVMTIQNAGDLGKEIYDCYLRRELIVLRRAVIPTGEVTHGLITSEDDTIHEHTRVFLRDVHDHALQIGDSVESLADLTKGLMDLYFSIVSNRANEVMKVLTVMATIFIPLTFVTGLYGMNFRYMPELEQPWAYPILLALMTLMVLAMVVWFRRLGWLGGHRRPRAQPQSLARNASSSSLRDSASSSPSSMSARR